MAKSDASVSEQVQGTFEQNILLTAKGGSFLFMGKLFTFGSRFVITLMLTRLLGPHNYGLYNIALSAAGLAAGLALLGLDSALVRYMALYSSRQDDDRVWGTLKFAVVISMVLSALTSAILFGLAHLIAVDIFHDPTLAPVLQFMSFLVPFLGLSDVLAGAARGFKRMDHMVLAQNLAQPLTRMVLIVVFALSGMDILRAVIAYGLADMVASIVLIYFISRYPAVRRPGRTARQEPREVLSYSVPMWLSTLITTFRGNIQTILLGSLNSAFTVGIFSVANQLNLFADLVQTSVTTAVRPIIVQVHDQGNRQELGRLYQTVSKWLFAFNLPIFLIVVLFPTQILSIFGKSFEEGATALVLLSWASVIDAFTGMCGAILDMTGYTKLKLANAIIRLSVVITFSLLLIPNYGMVGAATAALAGEITVNTLRLVEVYVLFRLVPYNLSYLKPILAGLLALVITLGAGNLLVNSQEGIQVVLQMSLLAGIYVVAVLLFGLDSEDRIVLSRMRRRATRTLAQIRA